MYIQIDAFISLFVPVPLYPAIFLYFYLLCLFLSPLASALFQPSLLLFSLRISPLLRRLFVSLK